MESRNNIDQRLTEIRRESSSDAAGDPERFRRIALTEREMMSQGEAIRATLEANAAPLHAIGQDLADRSIRRIVTMGCGDSWIAGHGVRPAIEAALGAPCQPVEAFDFATCGLATIDAETVVIGLSSSGKTEPVIDGLTGAAARGAYTIGLSNTLGSPLMEQCPGALHIRATRGGWPTQSSTAATALMLAVAAAITSAKGRDATPLTEALEVLPRQMDAVAQAFYEPAKAVAQHLARADLVLATGAGPFFAPAESGAAKLKELAPIHAYSFPLEEYHNYRTRKAGDPMFMVAGDAASHARALETAIMSRGSQGYCVALVPEGETEIAAIAHVPGTCHPWRMRPRRSSTACRCTSSGTMPLASVMRWGSARRASACDVTAELVTVGGLTVDNNIAADGTVALDVAGGNGAFSAVGALHWVNRVGLVSCAVASYPAASLTRLEAGGVDLAGDVWRDTEIAAGSWFLYDAKGRREEGLTETGVALAAAGFPSDRLTPAQVAAWRAHLAARTPSDLLGYAEFRSKHPLRAAQVPQTWRAVRGVHLAPSAPGVLRDMLDCFDHPETCVIADPGWQLAACTLDEITPLLERLDAFLPSEVALEALLPGMAHTDVLAALAARCPGAIALNRGSRGALVWDRDAAQAVPVPTERVDARDPTGAGDSFCAGFLAGRVRTGHPVKAAGLGAISAARTVSTFGAANALPDPGAPQLSQP